ncbi:MAG TPA: hypothetical protein VK735_39960 [Pseudonocardia sp.]|uniref:hypothetical protein n=1 Tax=Pseudonocardia sp. TaxID=60912 RepID=UPI002CEF55BA|nr:hypothetical protein [Pseudonocardia sp.]HTF53660.1 hypothetical protein [Pseudonocardia sp.]
MVNADDPAMKRIRKKFEDLEQDGLFEIEQTAKQSGELNRKAAKPKTIRSEKCDLCNKEKVGVIRVLDDEHRPHFILKDHEVKFGRANYRKCKGSGVEVGEHAN